MNHYQQRCALLFAALFSVVFLAGCESAYYNTMEKFGVHKRDILKDRIAEARDGQDDAKEQFSSALERFRTELAFDGGDLAKVYDHLNAEYEKSYEAANEVHERIDAVENVSEALFEEWEDELSQYTNASLRRQSESQLKSTKRHYTQMLAAMKKAEARMQPILDTFNDQVLFLKHNLNARAIDSLKTQFSGLDKDIKRLISDMDASIKEADRFIKTLEN